MPWRLRWTARKWPPKSRPTDRPRMCPTAPCSTCATRSACRSARSPSSTTCWLIWPRKAAANWASTCPRYRPTATNTGSEFCLCRRPPLRPNHSRAGARSYNTPSTPGTRQKVALAQRHTVVAQDGVSGGDVEEHVGQRSGLQVVLGAHRARARLAHGEGDFLRFLTIDGAGRYRLQPSHRVVDPGDQ